MKHLFSLLLFVTLAVGAVPSQAQEKTKDELVTSLIQLFANDDREALSQRVDYPIERRKPIPPISNRDEFLDRFDTLFDAPFVEAIVSSDPEEDWVKMGQKGIMLHRGALWLDSEGDILAVNYVSEAEHELGNAILDRQKRELHPSVSEFEEPKLNWTTDSYHIRVDDLGEQTYRYAAWPVGTPTSEKPEVVITDGDVNYEGSGGNHDYAFEQGDYRYVCQVTVIGHPDSFPGWIEIYKDGELIKEEHVRSTE
ncbi:hypothetical protein [Salinicola halophilus]|uniref:hypothetical protein n=1 Tax=Salinicola halophilus TaxID=184065 RepID=UPI000DA163DC|nr:hypothetical protein [Salinicola halophilus]